MPLWGIVQNSELIKQTSTKVHLLSRPYAGASGCASHFQKATPLPVALHGSFIHLGLCQNILISQCYIFHMILLGGIANTPGVGLLAADQRGYRNVFQAGFWRRAWLWRRMGKCPGGRQAVLGAGAERCWQKSTERDVHLLYNLTWARSLGHQSLHFMHCKMFGWGKEEGCRSGNGSTKVEKQECWGERRFTPSFLSGFPAKSACQSEEIPGIATPNGGGKRERQNDNKRHSQVSIRIQ